MKKISLTIERAFLPFLPIILAFCAGCQEEENYLDFRFIEPNQIAFTQKSFAPGDSLVFQLGYESSHKVEIIDVKWSRVNVQKVQEEPELILFESFYPNKNKGTFWVRWLIPSNISPTPDGFGEHIDVAIKFGGGTLSDGTGFRISDQDTTARIVKKYAM